MDNFVITAVDDCTSFLLLLMHFFLIFSGNNFEERRLQSLMQFRIERTLTNPEPNLDEANVTVIVRHPILGNKVRLFRENDLFLAV